MYARTLAEHVRAYLDLQMFLDECRADGIETDRAERAVERARREIDDALRGAQPPEGLGLAEAARAYLDAEHQFDKCGAAGADLDIPARRMEQARRELERQIGALAVDEVGDVQGEREIRTRPKAPPAPPHRRRILVAYDESAPARYALDAAVKMALESGGKVILVHVVRPARSAAGEYVSTLEWLDTLHHREAEEMLAAVCRSLPPSITATHMVREGVPAEEILAAAQIWQAEVILIGTRARGRLAQFLLGSTAEAVIRRAACPVMTVGRRVSWATVPPPGIPVSESSAAVTSTPSTPKMA
jgi:nucleotide-binding universal stress UspA family protein